jgi:hypothetical protein
MFQGSLSRGFHCRQEQPRELPVSADISNRTYRRAGQGTGRAVVFPKRRQGMGLFTRDIKTMNDLFVHQLQDIYYAEKQLVKALPKMADKATDKQLKQLSNPPR